jgi:hypothetical protein
MLPEMPKCLHYQLRNVGWDSVYGMDNPTSRKDGRFLKGSGRCVEMRRAMRARTSFGTPSSRTYLPLCVFFRS